LVHRAMSRLGESAYRRLTAAESFAPAKPQTGPAHVPIRPSGRTTRATGAREIPRRPVKPWGNVARRQRGGIMDRVERSFAAATAAGFVVLVIGIVLLALM